MLLPSLLLLVAGYKGGNCSFEIITDLDLDFAVDLDFERDLDLDLEEGLEIPESNNTELVLLFELMEPDLVSDEAVPLVWSLACRTRKGAGLALVASYTPY